MTVVRPSIVVGESDSGWTPAFKVIYWPLRAFARGLLAEVPAPAAAAALDRTDGTVRAALAAVAEEP